MRPEGKTAAEIEAIAAQALKPAAERLEAKERTEAEAEARALEQHEQPADARKLEAAIAEIEELQRERDELKNAVANLTAGGAKPEPNPIEDEAESDEEGDLLDKIEALIIAEDEREKLTVDLKIGLINHLFEFLGLTSDDIRSAVAKKKPARTSKKAPAKDQETPATKPLVWKLQSQDGWSETWRAKAGKGYYEIRQHDASGKKYYVAKHLFRRKERTVTPDNVKDCLAIKTPDEAKPFAERDWERPGAEARTSKTEQPGFISL